MKCPYCNSTKTKVTNKRDSEEEGITRRRRECLKCGRRDKLTSGLTKACEKRPVSHEKIEKIVNEIEERLRRKGNEVKSEVIGKLIMQHLKKLDKVAYVRFASVYEDFQDLSDFKSLFRNILDNPKNTLKK